MFCKKCGKVIAADSMFCKYCGAKQDLDIVEEKLQKKNDIKVKEDVLDMHKPEMEKEVQKNKSAFADEMVAISKLLFVALLLWGLYMAGYVVYRSNDTKRSPELPFGASCYDPELITGNYVLNEDDAESKFKELIAIEKKNLERHKGEIILDENGNKVSAEPYFRHYTIMTEQEKEQWKKQEIEKGHAEWNSMINSYRLDGYENELKKNSWYSILIILCVFLTGRYVYKSVNWVNKNKTK